MTAFSFVRAHLVGTFDSRGVIAVDISDEQRELFGELLWNALAETPEENWSDYDAVVLTYVQVASVAALKLSRDSLPEFVQERIDAELKARGE